MDGYDFYKLVENFLPQVFAQTSIYQISIEYYDNFGQLFLLNENSDFEDENLFSYRDFDCDLIENEYVNYPDPPLLDGYVFINKLYIENLNSNNDSGILVDLTKNFLTFNEYNRSELIEPGEIIINFITNQTYNNNNYFYFDYYINNTSTNKFCDLENNSYFYKSNFINTIENPVELIIQITYLTTNDNAVNIDYFEKTTDESRSTYLQSTIFNKNTYLTPITNNDDITPITLNLQNKTIELNENVQNFLVEPDIGWEGLGSVDISTNIPSAQLQTKTVTLESSYSYYPVGPTSTTYTPDTGYDGFESFTVAVNSLLVQQSKTFSATSNNTYTILPDNGYSSIKSVSVSVNVSPVLENRYITSNGVYRPYTGYDGFAEVNVQIPNNKPKLKYIGLANTLIVTSYSDLSINDYTQATTTTAVPIAEGKTLVIVTYSSNYIDIEVYGRQTNSTSFQKQVYRNSFYKILNYEIGYQVFYFSSDNNLMFANSTAIYSGYNNVYYQAFRLYNNVLDYYNLS